MNPFYNSGKFELCEVCIVLVFFAFPLFFDFVRPNTMIFVLHVENNHFFRNAAKLSGRVRETMWCMVVTAKARKLVELLNFFFAPEVNKYTYA